MHRSFRFLLLATCIALPSAAQAQNIPGWVYQYKPGVGRSPGGATLGGGTWDDWFGSKVDVTGGNGNAVKVNTGGLANTSLPLSSILDFDIRFYGAACNGVVNADGTFGGTDDGPAIQRAVNAAVAAGGGVVKLPALSILWNTTVNLSGASVRIQGAGWAEDVSSGTRILQSSTANTLLAVSGTAVRGGGLFGMSFRQVHSTNFVSGWTPTVYPFVVTLTNLGGEFRIDEVMVFNCYQFVYSLNSGRTNFGRIRGQPLFNGITIDVSLDTTHGGDIHFWPYWTANSFVLSWMQANADAIHLLRCDGFQFPNIFVLGYRCGLRLSYGTGSTPGATTEAQIGNLYCDSCQYAVWFDGNSGSLQVGNLYTGGQGVTSGVIAGSCAVYMNAANCVIKIGNFRGLQTAAYMLVMDQTAGGNLFAASNVDFDLPDQTVTTDPIIFSQNCTTPNIIRIANPVNIISGTGSSLVNASTAWVRIPQNTPAIFNAPASGSSISLLTSNPLNIVEPAAALAALTVVLPATFDINGELTLLSTQNVTALTISAGTTIIVAPPAGLTAGKAIRLLYQSSTVTAEGTNAWFCM